MEFRDHFAGVASTYAEYRPAYPPALFSWLGSVVDSRGLAWDCACGSGQATSALAGIFREVVATDASVAQLANAAPVANAIYAGAAAESAPLHDRTVDLVAVASALHWFVGEEFYQEVRRVLVPGGVFAAWTYGLPELEDPGLARVVGRFSTATLGPYWPEEVAHVKDGYSRISVPFTAIDAPVFELRMEWTLRRFLGFVRTWSGSARYRAELSSDPVTLLESALGSRWGGADTARMVKWKLALRAGRA